MLYRFLFSRYLHYMIKSNNVKRAIKELEITTANIPSLSFFASWYIIAITSTLLTMFLVVDIGANTREVDSGFLIGLFAAFVSVFIVFSCIVQYNRFQFKKAAQNNRGRRNSNSVTLSFSL